MAGQAEPSILTKRLHISGLTESITPEDLKNRLSTFGRVVSVDGFGPEWVDGLGRRRGFGYVTLEGTSSGLARCLNLLSGSTWKGAKLRIGEAKPDFLSRLAKERTSPPTPKPHKRPHSHGTYAPDMSLITPSNAAGRAGWKVTPMGRVVRSMKMRPGRPLPPMTEDLALASARAKEKGKGKGKGKGEEEGGKKKKKRVREPDGRARRRVIDVTRWPSVYLKGAFLGMDLVVPGVGVGVGGAVSAEGGEVVGGDEDDDDEDEEDEDEGREEEKEQEREKEAPTGGEPQVTPTPHNTTSNPTTIPNPNPNLTDPSPPTSLQQETLQSLSLLNSLFGDSGAGGDWGGSESVGSDIDEEALMKGVVVIDEGGEDEDVGFEIVPASVESGRLGRGGGGGEGESGMEVDGEGEVGEDVEMEMEMEMETGTTGPQPQNASQPIKQKLKDLFAPRETDAGFSLVGHLDLDFDLELDDEIPFHITHAQAHENEGGHENEDESPHPTHPTHPTQTPKHAHPHTHTHTHAQTPHPNPKHPLFFPLPHSHSHSSNTALKAHPPDLFELARPTGARGTPSAGTEFFRTGTEAEIRAAWEEGRGKLTRGWRKRWREAGKVGRRRGRGRGGVGAGGELGE